MSISIGITLYPQYSAMTKDMLLVFQRNAVLGKVKTRLATGVGAPRAWEIYRYLVQHTHQVVSRVNVPVGIFVDEELSDGKPAIAQWMRLQQGKDLGEKMAHAFQESFALGADRVVLIGTDCPTLSVELLTQAFDDLSQVDLVLGPASDGGYYLLGMRQVQLTLFENIAWSTASVLSETIKRAEIAGLSVSLLPVLADVDTAADWKKHLAQHPEAGYL